MRRTSNSHTHTDRVRPSSFTAKRQLSEGRLYATAVHGQSRLANWLQFNAVCTTVQSATADQPNWTPTPTVMANCGKQSKKTETNNERAQTEIETRGTVDTRQSKNHQAMKKLAMLQFYPTRSHCTCPYRFQRGLYRAQQMPKVNVGFRFQHLHTLERRQMRSISAHLFTDTHMCIKICTCVQYIAWNSSWLISANCHVTSIWENLNKFAINNTLNQTKLDNVVFYIYNIHRAQYKVCYC